MGAPRVATHDFSAYRLLRVAHALFWAGTGLVFSALIAVAPSLSRDLSQSVVSGAWIAGFGFVCSLIAGFPAAVMRTRLSVGLRTLFVLMAWFGLVAFFGWRTSGPSFLSRATLLPNFVLMLVLLCCWVAVAFVVRGAVALHTEALRAERALADAREQRLARLRSQLAPHFICNALNAICARIDEGPLAAQRMTADLADLVRDALRDLGDEGTVAEELQRLRPYLALEQARFEERLEVELRVDPGVLGERLPPLLLQPLVENAIRHGVPEAGRPLVVTVEIRRGAAGELAASVENAGALGGAAERRGLGVGVENVRRRLQELYPGTHELSLSERDGRVCAAFRLWSAS